MGFLKRSRRPRPSGRRKPEERSELLAPPGTFDRVDAIQDSIRELYTGLSSPKVKAFTANLAPVLAEVSHGDPIMSAQEMARTMARHLGITDAQLIVGFARLGDSGQSHAGEVELGPGPEYFITLSARYRDDPRDIPAVLAHEVMHVFLHRNGIRFPDPGKNEILTDTATIYLGIGWLMLMAHRVEVTQDRHARWTSTSRLGYISPAEMGYVLAKRALAFDENIEPYLAGNFSARHAYRLGYQRAQQDYAIAPLTGCTGADRAQYTKDKQHATDLTKAMGMSGLARPYAGGYRFDGYDPMKVTFACPACHQRIRVAVDKTVRVRCRVCGSIFDCTT